jgi:threonine dehydrogenase-like Zn-dependent dehydrogenase
MYCQSCGTETQPGLNYCNRCGAQVTSLATPQAERVVFVPSDVTGPVRWLAATICATMILGFIVLFTAIGHLAGRGVQADPLVVIAGLGLIGIFVVELSLIRMMSRLIFEGREQAQLAAAKKSNAQELRPASAQQLAQPAPVSTAATGPVHSVTDHTTRTLEHAYRESRA